MNGSEEENIISVYERKLREQVELRREIAELKPQICQFLQALPRRSFHNFRICSVSHRGPINKPYLIECIEKFVKIHIPNLAETEQFSLLLTEFIYNERSSIDVIRIKSTRAKKRKLSDVLGEE